MKQLRILALAAALVAVSLWPAAAQAGNVAWVGITGPEAIQERWSGECIGVSPREPNTRETVGQIGPPESHYEIVDDGVIKAWTALGYTQAAANNPPQDPPDAYVRFDLLRPFATRHPTKIAESQPAAHLDGLTSNPFTQAVQAGDGIGVDLESNPSNEESQAWIGCTAGSATTFGANNAVWSPPLVSNAGPAGEPEESADPDYGLELGAEVEYDAPVITGISPSSGPLGGETKATITGSHLKLDNVHLGANDSGKYEDADGQSVIRVPRGEGLGPVDVIVKTAGGTATLVDGYTYVEGQGGDGGGSGGSGGGGGQSTPEVPAKPTPGPAPAPAPSGGSVAPTDFKLPRVKVAKAGGTLSLTPTAPSAGVFHVQGVVVLPGDPHASHTRSVVYGSAAAHAGGPGPLAIKLAPSIAAKRLLGRSHALHVHLTVTFTAATGDRSTHSTVVTIRGGRP